MAGERTDPISAPSRHALRWVSLVDDLQVHELELKPLTADIEYEVRVRAVNSKGASEWRDLRFRTKQDPTKSDDGERAGGYGPAGADGRSYTWLQSLKDDSVCVTLGPLPAGTRAKQIAVGVMPTHLTVRLDGADALVGDFFGSVSAEEYSAYTYLHHEYYITFFTMSI